MSDHIDKIFAKKVNPTTLKRNKGLFSSVTLGVGALMGAGIYILIGLAAEKAGPSLWLSYFICGILAFATTLVYVEWAKRMPEKTGSFQYVYSTLGSLGGFATGWFLLLGSLFASSLYALGFSEYFSNLLGVESKVLVKLFAIVVVLLLFLSNTKKSSGSDKVQVILTWGNLAILVILILVSLRHINIDNAIPHFRNGLSGTLSTISVIYISFFGYQLISDNAKEIKDPKETMPKAMKYSMYISIFFYVILGLIAVLVVNSDTLASSSTALLEVANVSIGKFGFYFISAGAILASAAALNSTLVALSRQLISLAETGFFPNWLSIIDTKSETPRVALTVTVGLVLAIILFADLEFVAKSTSFCLLLALIFVCLGLRKHYRQNPKLKEELKWKYYLPELALASNVLMLCTLDIVSLSFGQQLVLAGALFYFFYSRRKERFFKDGMTIQLGKNINAKLFQRGTKVLIPLSNPKNVEKLLKISEALLKKGGEASILNVVKSEKKDEHLSTLKESSDSLDLIKKSISISERSKLKVKPIIRVSTNIVEGIITASEQENADLILMGQSKNIKSQNSISEQTLLQASVDTIFLNFKDGMFFPRKILVPVSGMDNIELIVELGTRLAEQYKGTVTFINILPESFTKKQRKKSNKLINEVFKNFHTSALFEIKLISHNEPLELIIGLSDEYDLLIMGAGQSAFFKNKEFGDAVQYVNEHAQASLAVVKQVNFSTKMLGKIK